jgi:hypothetical protein
VTGVPCTADATPDSAYAYGCDWDTDLMVEIPADWPSGMYRVRVLTPDHDEEGFATFALREAVPGSTAQILALYSDTTDQAYNSWGGKSLYESGSSDGVRSPRVSFERPNVLGRGMGYLGAERHRGFLEWSEDRHLDIAYCTATDLHRMPELLSAYTILLTFGHNEYWSLEERVAVENWLADGGNAVLLAGNECWWRVAFEDSAATRMLCTKVDGETTSRWNQAPNLWPANSLGGANSGLPAAPGAFLVGYDDEWTVTDPDHPIVRGLPTTFHTSQILDDEVDGLTLDAGATRPAAEDFAWGTPADTRILARARARAFGVSGLYAWATMSAFTTPGGGKVFKMGFRNLTSEIRGNPQLQAMVLRALAWIRPGTGVGDEPSPARWMPRNPRPAGRLAVPGPVRAYDVAGRWIASGDDRGGLLLDRPGVWFLRFENDEHPPRRILVLP